MAEAVDVLQIPAFLCRQTDLLLRRGETGRAINVKKGQFLAPWDMKNVAAKLASAGQPQDPAVRARRQLRLQHAGLDMRVAPDHGARPAIRWCSMRRTRCSSRAGRANRPAASGEFVPVLARAAVAVGVAAVFMETHQDPDNAPSDGPNMVYLKDLPGILEALVQFDRLAKANPLF